MLLRSLNSLILESAENRIFHTHGLGGMSSVAIYNTVKAMLSKKLMKSRKLVAKDRCLLNTGRYILIWLARE